MEDAVRDPAVSSSRGLVELLLDACSSMTVPSASQAKTLDRLQALRHRLVEERFQLAVLGQFKRGKSTLLNALLGVPVLPSGVIPVTAVPTFLQAATAPRLRVTYITGATTEFEIAGSATIRERLSQLVTEEANPKNALSLARVDVLLPSPLLAQGVVLVDTPGVGSTLRHNTTTAEAALAECDAALFVLSPDPPITEVEVDYLSQIRRNVARIIVVLNKIDTVAPEEQATAEAYLRGVLVKQAGMPPGTAIFALSARNALRAKESGDTGALRASGLPDLEAHLVQFLASEKQATLRAAVARKASDLIGELRLEAEIALRALLLPIEDLQQRMRTFDESVVGFEAERGMARDLLAGDRRRALDELDADADRLRGQARTLLEGELDRALGRGDDLDQVRQGLGAAAVSFFEANLQEVAGEIEERVATTLGAHQRRADDLITLVRRTAADLLNIPFRAPEGREAFALSRQPYWMKSGRTEVLNPIHAGFFDGLLPAPLRRARLRARLLDETEALIRRNAENLRWAMRQNLEDTFRRFGTELDERLAMSLTATHGAMTAALDRHRQQSEDVAAEIARGQALCAHLGTIADALEHIQEPITGDDDNRKT